MNPILSLQNIDCKGGETAVLPYVYMRGCDSLGKWGVLAIMIQYDSPETENRHVSVTPENYAQAPHVWVKHKDKDVMLYLVKAEKDRSDNVRVETPFGNGTLWGWFPKERV